ncbi:hypothetical protein CBL_20889 [Carabus blaptoides fortunei]
MECEQSASQLPDSESNEDDDFTTVGHAKRVKLTHPTQPVSSISTKNKYDALLDTEMDVVEQTHTDAQTDAVPQTKKRAPPPIFLRTKDDYALLSRGLARTNIKFSRVTNSKDDVKFQPETEADYKCLVKVLEKLKLPFHTFELPEEKSLKVVLRGLLETIPEKDILDELLLLGYPTIKCKRLSFNGRASPLVHLGQTEKCDRKKHLPTKNTIPRGIKSGSKEKKQHEVREPRTTNAGTPPRTSTQSNTDNVMAFACSLLTSIASANNKAESMAMVLKSLPDLYSILNGGK